jgi:hydrogenase maturation protein HypF
MPRLLPPPYPYRVAENGVLDFSAMIREMVEDIRRGEAVESVSRRFHATIVHSASVMCARLREKTGLNTVAVSGGVFQNRLIFRFLVDRLTDQGFTVLYPRLVPPNDGGVCLGQGMVALNALGRGEKCA